MIIISVNVRCVSVYDMIFSLTTEIFKAILNVPCTVMAEKIHPPKIITTMTTTRTGYLFLMKNSTGYFNARGQKKEDMYIVEAERWRGEIRMRIN